MNIPMAKPEKVIFVIMPFTETPTRNKEQLSSFFEDTIKNPIEVEEFINRYKVRRSDETFNITEQIIKDLFAADIVIADLSGKQPNPNVMYELGVRLALSNKPVILMRENHPDNRNVFDITGFYAHPYDPFKYGELQKHLIEKIHRFETREEVYESPILKVIGGNAALQHSALRELSSEKQWELVLQGIQIVAKYSAIAFGSNGKRVSFSLPDREISTRSGLDIVNNIHDEDLLKALGIQKSLILANEIKSSIGDGVKTASIIAETILTFIHQQTKGEQSQKYITDAVRNSLNSAIENLKIRSEKFIANHHLLGAAITAAKDPEVGGRVVEALAKVQDKELIFVSEHNDPVSQLEIVDKHLFDFGYISQNFVTDLESNTCILDNCHILLCIDKISSMREVLPILEYAAHRDHSVLIMAADVEAEALATIIYNKEKGTIRCGAVRIPSRGANIEIIKDFATLTKSTLIGFDSGRTLNKLQESDFGHAEKITISSTTIQVTGGAGLEADITLRVKRIREELNSGLSESHRLYLRSRLASLLGKAAVIKTGGSINILSREENYKTLSALSAITSLAEEGWVVGGGETLLKISEHLDKQRISIPEQALGFNAVIAGLRQPYLTLMKNGQEDRANYSQNLMKNNIIDSVKILRRVLELVRDHVCVILETEKWDVSPRTIRSWPDSDNYFNS